MDDPRKLYGTWPGEPDDGFEEAIDESRHPERFYRNQLLAEKVVLERMLASLPESSVIDRMSLEARKAEVEKEIADERGKND